jgi:hypothetical protein
VENVVDESTASQRVRDSWAALKRKAPWSGLPTLPTKPSSDVLGRQALTLVCDDVGWVYRRKESVSLEGSTTARRQVSVDFAVPGDVAPLARTQQREPVYFAPVLFLRKAPRLLTKFDFRDESGRALALPTRKENGATSAAMLVCLAERVLGHAPSASVERELTAIAEDHPPRSHVLTDRFRTPAADAERRQLCSDEVFSWLLSALADSSVVTIPVASPTGERKVVKLSYDVPIADLDYSEAAYRYGLQGYLGYFDLPFLGARNYHFELHAPGGMEVIEAGFVDAAEPRKLLVTHGPSNRVHFYRQEAHATKSALAYAQLRVTGKGFLSGAAFASFLVAASVTACFAFASQLSQAATSTPSLLILFPGVLANYVARPGRHPLTTHLLSRARALLMVSGGVAFVGAARLSVISQHHPAAETSLRWQFLVLALIAWVLALTLFAARSRFLPRRISRQRGTRRRAEKMGATIEEIDDESS